MGLPDYLDSHTTPPSIDPGLCPPEEMKAGGMNATTNPIVTHPIRFPISGMGMAEKKILAFSGNIIRLWLLFG
jgi:hypothetical protein